MGNVHDDQSIIEILNKVAYINLEKHGTLSIIAPLNLGETARIALLFSLIFH
jgi:hypothetical protein